MTRAIAYYIRQLSAALTLLFLVAIPISGQQNLRLNNNSGDDDFQGVIGKTDKDSKPYFAHPLQPKAGSPNIVYIVLDDVGFSDLGVMDLRSTRPTLTGWRLEVFGSTIFIHGPYALPLAPRC